MARRASCQATQPAVLLDLDQLAVGDVEPHDGELAEGRGLLEFDRALLVQLEDRPGSAR